ncbi:MAG: hypothetical protein Q9M13_01485 [Mariprofundales bacterium]|nr:hypothetical protein [Mariprofundales bacterium]
MISSYQAKLLLPQLKPPVKAVSQVNSDAVSRAGAQRSADQRQADINSAKRLDAQRLTAAALDRASVLQRQLEAGASPKSPPATDRVTIGRVSENAQSTLASVNTPSELDMYAPPRGVEVESRRANTDVYTLRDVAKRSGERAAVIAAKSLVESVEIVSLPPLSSPQLPISSSAAVAQQYQRNAVSTSSVADSSDSSGLNVRV